MTLPGLPQTSSLCQQHSAGRLPSTLAPPPRIALDGATLKRTRIVPLRNPCLGDDFSMKHSQLCEWHSPAFPVGRWQIPGYVFFQSQPLGWWCGDTLKRYQSFGNPPAKAWRTAWAYGNTPTERHTTAWRASVSRQHARIQPARCHGLPSHSSLPQSTKLLLCLN